MASSSSFTNKILSPPLEVRGMMQLDRGKFSKRIEFPCIRVPVKRIDRLKYTAYIRGFMVENMPKFKAFREIVDDSGGATNGDERLLIFDPDKFANATEEQREELLAKIAELVDDGQPKMDKFVHQMEYENWDAKQAIKAILPAGLEFGGFEKCGHIIHVNLRDDIAAFRFVLGQILFDKVPNTRTVLNKMDMLTNEFRVMDAELLAGEADYETEVLEHGIRYKLDYSKVFWNSRLSTVHAKTVEKFDQHSVVFDVFAGIGPFILPAVKKQGVQRAYANDLNPDAINFLRQSMKVNKIPDDRVETFMMDGAQFIRTVIPEKVVEHCRSTDENAEKPPLNIHVVMNLPGHSADHLPHFRGIFSNIAASLRPILDRITFLIHCHFFVKANDDLPPKWYEEEAARIVHSKMATASQLKIQELNFNRKVSSRKSMYCARIQLPMEYAFATVDADSSPSLMADGKFDAEKTTMMMRRNVEEEEGMENRKREAADSDGHINEGDSNQLTRPKMQRIS